MKDPLRVYIVHEPGCPDAPLCVQTLREAFDAQGMQRDGLPAAVDAFLRLLLAAPKV